MNPSARRCIWRYHLQAVVWDCQILNQVVESQLFTSLWNGNHRRISDVKLIQVISAFQLLLPGLTLLSHCWRANRGLISSRYSRTPDNDHLHNKDHLHIFKVYGSTEPTTLRDCFSFPSITESRAHSIFVIRSVETRGTQVQSHEPLVKRSFEAFPRPKILYPTSFQLLLPSSRT
jgi:hypothetical protein